VTPDKSAVLYGTLGLMIVKTLEALGPLHGYRIARRIEQISGNQLALNQGTLYPALLELEQMGWISSKWGTSESGRRVRIYILARAGHKQLHQEEAQWQRAAYGSNPLPGAGIVARSDSDPSVVATVLREQVRAVDPDLPLFEMMRLDDLLAASDERVGLHVFGTMFVVFGFVALLLATVGVYAVTAYAAAQRTREIGVRVALGAQAAQIWWLVTRSAVWQLGFGLSIGMVGAIGIGHLLGSVLVGTNAMDPLTLFAVAGLLGVAGLSACLLAARRAMRLDPAAVLRYE
jgi:PadR family transcriptional regulator PadR